MDLGKHIVDRLLLDRDGRRAGMVDDLLLEIPPLDTHGQAAPPRVMAVVSGPMALACQLPRPLRWMAHALYRMLGIAAPQPVEIPWSTVTAIDVVVHLDVTRERVGLDTIAQAVDRRVISHIPGA